MRVCRGRVDMVMYNYSKGAVLVVLLICSVLPPCFARPRDAQRMFV